MQKGFATAVFILLVTLKVTGQNRAVEFEELKGLQVTDPKPVVVLVMTDWCKYCHAMRNMMLKNQKVAPLLRANFRTVFLNAEEKREIFFAGKTFRYKSGINELAKQLALNNGRISYPTISILNHKNEIIYQYDGYLSAQAMYYTLKKVGRPAN